MPKYDHFLSFISPSFSCLFPPRPHPRTEPYTASLKTLVLLLVFIEFSITLKAWKLNILSSFLPQKEKKLIVKVFSFSCSQ